MKSPLRYLASDVSVILITAAWLLVNGIPWSASSQSMFDNLGVFLSQLISGSSNPTNSIAPFTALAGILCFLSALILLPQIPKWKRVIVSTSTVFIFAATFELIWLLFFYLKPDPSAPYLGLFNSLIFGSWVLFGFIGLPYWKIGRVSVLVLATLIILFVTWAVIGYPQIFDTSPNPYQFLARPVNIGTKLTTGLFIISLIYDGSRTINHRSRFPNLMLVNPRIPTRLFWTHANNQW